MSCKMFAALVVIGPFFVTSASEDLYAALESNQVPPWLYGRSTLDDAEAVDLTLADDGSDGHAWSNTQNEVEDQAHSDDSHAASGAHIVTSVFSVTDDSDDEWDGDSDSGWDDDGDYYYWDDDGDYYWDDDGDYYSDDGGYYEDDD